MSDNSILFPVVWFTGTIAVMVLASAAYYYLHKPYPGCRRRLATKSWDEACVDSSPDLRYKHNARRCDTCGYVYTHY